MRKNNQRQCMLKRKRVQSGDIAKGQCLSPSLSLLSVSSFPSEDNRRDISNGIRAYFFL